VNFSPGWGKRSERFAQIYPGGLLHKRGAVNFSPGWGKRSGGSVNFSPGWGKRSGGSVNFSPGWGKRSGGTVNFSPSWGKRSGGTVNFSPSWGKRSGGSVNFSPGWGKRSGGTVNFSPSWGKRSSVNYQGLNNYFEDGIPKEQSNIFVPFWKGGYGLSRLGRSPDNHLARLQQLSQISRLEKRNIAPDEILNDDEENEKFDGINNEPPISSSDISHDFSTDGTDFDSVDVNNVKDDGMNQAYMDELKLGIHNWKRSVQNEVSPILDEEN